MVVFTRTEPLNLKHCDDAELWWASVLGGGGTQVAQWGFMLEPGYTDSRNLGLK